MKLRMVTVGNIPLAMTRSQGDQPSVNVLGLPTVGSNLAGDAMRFFNNYLQFNKTEYEYAIQ